MSALARLANAIFGRAIPPPITFPSPSSQSGIVVTDIILPDPVAIVGLHDDVAVVMTPDGDFGVRFETSCESLVTIWCYEEDGARELAGLLRREMMSAAVDVQLDKVLV